MNSTFIKKACGQISDKAQRNLVAAELEAHISDKADYYRELGYDEETSLDKAIEDMGDPRKSPRRSTRFTNQTALSALS